jgi:hypothetical protein
MAKISITFDFNDFNEATAFLGQHNAALAKASAPLVVEVVEDPAAEEKPAAKPPKKAAKPVKAEPVAEPVPPTIKEVRAALQHLLATKGTAACSDVLTAADVRRIGELSSSAYPAFIESCQKAAA